MTCTRGTPPESARSIAATFGSMPSRDPALFAQPPQTRAIDVRDQRARIVARLEYAGRARREDEFLGLELAGDHRGDGVGVDVEQRAVIVGRQRAHDRHEVVVELLDEDARVDAVDVADETVIDDLRAATCTGGRLLALIRPPSTPLMPIAGMPSARQTATIRVLISPFSTIVETSSVCASVTRRPSTICVASPKRFDNCVDCGPPPCTSDDANADLMQDADLLHQRPRRLGRDERVAAGLQDEHLALDRRGCTGAHGAAP